MCVLLIYTISLSILCVSKERFNLVESNQQTYTYTSGQFLKSKDIVHLCKVNFCISKLFTECNTVSCCVLMTGGANMYLYVHLSLLVPVCPVSLVYIAAYIT